MADGSGRPSHYTHPLLYSGGPEVPGTDGYTSEFFRKGGPSGTATRLALAHLTGNLNRSIQDGGGRSRKQEGSWPTVDGALACGASWVVCSSHLTEDDF